MLTKMSSPAFKIQGKERPPIEFKEGLNVVLGKDDGAMSIGKSSALLAIDFVFGGDTYIKSDGVRQEGHHTVFFEFTFDGKPYWFARNTGDADKVFKGLQTQLQAIREQIRQLGFAENISKEFLDRRSELKAEIDALKTQNRAFLTQKELQDAKAKAEEALRRSIEGILAEIEETLNAKMKEFNDTLFKTHRKPPHIKFNKHDSYKFETPDDTGTGSNYKGMIVYDLAVLFTTALPALAHDSLVFKNLEKDVEDGIMRIYASTRKQIFIAYDKQGDCRPETQRILYDNCVLQLSDNNCELYGRSWNKEEQK